MKNWEKPLSFFFGFFVLCFEIFSCGGGGGPEVIVFGKLVDATSGLSIATNQNTLISVGDISSSANEGGFFSVKVSADSEKVFNVNTDGYVPAAKYVQTPETGSMFIEIPMLPWTNTGPLDPATGGTISGSGASVTFPAGSIDASGTVTTSLAYLDPTDQSQRAAFPGGFLTEDGSMLESFGAIAVEVRDSQKNVVNLKSGKTASISIPVKNTTQSSIPLWYFDEAQGRWKEEGSLTGCSDGTCEGSVSHLSWWNADIMYEVTCVTACPTNGDGEPAQGVALEARGKDYNGNSYSTTQSDGCACINVKPNSQIDLIGMTSGGISIPITMTTPSTLGQCGQSECPKITDPMIIENPKFQAILTWGESPADLDSHFTGPCAESYGCTDNQFHISYTNRGSLNSFPYAYLDTDDTSSFGPEITSLARCQAGLYRFYVHNFSGSPGMETPKQEVRAKVAVLLTSGEILEYTISTSNPEAALYWVVGELTCDASCSCSWAEVNAFQTEEPNP